MARGAAAARSAPAASPREVQRRARPGPGRSGLDPEELRRLGETSTTCRSSSAAGAFLDQYLDVLGDQSALDYADLIRRAVIEADRGTATSSGARYRHVFVDEYQDTDPARSRCCGRSPATAATSSVVGDPHQSIYAFRGADVRGILEFPTRVPARAGGRAPPVARRSARPGGSAPACLARVRGRRRRHRR